MKKLHQVGFNGRMPVTTSCDLVKAAIEFRNPGRIPIEDLAQPDTSDIVGVGFEPTIWQWQKNADGSQECVDLFDCLRRRHDGGIGEVIKPPIEEWADADKFVLPDVAKLKKQTEIALRAVGAGKFVLGDLGQQTYKIFELCGVESTLLALGLWPEKVKDLAKRLTDFAIARTEMYASLGNIHGISIYDDWGTQNSMILSPAQWHELFFDLYHDLFSYAHQRHLYVYFHCCGAIDPIIPDLISAGADIINFDQPRLHGIKSLGDKYAGKVCFCCPVDIQATLPSRDKDRIRQEAIELVNCLHRKGGFIAKIYHDWAKSDDNFDAAQYSKEIFASLNV